MAPSISSSTPAGSERVDALSTVVSTTAHVTLPKSHSPTVHAVSSQVASAVSTLTFYPLDVVKMRFMSQDGTPERRHNQRYYRSIVQSLRIIYHAEGLRAWYRGAHVAVGGAVAAWGSYMYTYRWLLDYSGAKPGDLAFNIWASFVGSTVCACLTCPIWLVKTRMQLEESAYGLDPTRHRKYASFAQSFRQILRADAGVWGLWVGLRAQVLLGIPNSLNLPVYELLKSVRMRQTQAERLSNTDVTLCSTLSKVIIATVSHPIVVLKTRLQDERSHAGAVTYNSVTQAMRTTVRREGLRGLYRGAWPAVAQAVPRSVAQFLVYEFCLWELDGGGSGKP